MDAFDWVLLAGLGLLLVGAVGLVVWIATFKLPEEEE
jgi:preprotein translocase subunit Sss1